MQATASGRWQRQTHAHCAEGFCAAAFGFRAQRYATHPGGPPAIQLARLRVRNLIRSLMARIPLEDNFNDVINKAQRGLRISDEDLALRAEVSATDLIAVKAGKPIDAVTRRVARHLRLSADALEALSHKSWYPQQANFPAGFAAFNTPYEDMTVNSYLVWDARTKMAAAFDTGADCQAMLDVLHAEDLSLRYIFITHTHEDHIADLPKLAAETKAEVWANELEPAPAPGTKTFKENAHFHIGPIAIKTLLTSGHSPGQTTFYITGLSWPLAIVGDSLFASSIGGSATHFAEQLRNDREKIFSLPNDTVLACGHGPLTTLRQEKNHNPFFAR
jgi:hydroxyacylglutathione hydrolase